MPGHILEAPQAAFNAEESATQGRVGSMYQHTQCSIFVFLFIFKFDIKCIEACSLQPDNPQEQENTSVHGDPLDTGHFFHISPPQGPLF